jgi:hypothetical protein
MAFNLLLGYSVLQLVFSLAVVTPNLIPHGDLKIQDSFHVFPGHPSNLEPYRVFFSNRVLSCV